MGYQVAISMLRDDEDAFLRFLRQTADVRVFRTFAADREGLSVVDFSEAPSGECHFFLHNTEFAWTPTYGRVADDAPVVARRGFIYHANTGSAPLLEYDRHLYASTTSPGRLYWGEGFAAPDGLNYDTAAFKRWYDHAVQWVTTHGRKLATDLEHRLYLPAAYSEAAHAVQRK